jgi:hypothetical protein
VRRGRNRGRASIPSGGLSSGSSSCFAGHRYPARVLLLPSNGGFRFVWCRVVPGEEVRSTHDVFSCHMDGFGVSAVARLEVLDHKDPGRR